MYQLKKYINSLFTFAHRRGKNKFILVLSFVLSFAFLPERAHADCWNFCAFGGVFVTCCTTQQEAINKLYSSPPMGLCHVHIFAQPINDFGGMIYFEQCDPYGNTFFRGSIPFLIVGELCNDGASRSCECEDGCPGEQKCINGAWGSCICNPCCPIGEGK